MASRCWTVFSLRVRGPRIADIASDTPQIWGSPWVDDDSKRPGAPVLSSFVFFGQDELLGRISDTSLVHVNQPHEILSTREERLMVLTTFMLSATRLGTNFSSEKRFFTWTLPTGASVYATSFSCVLASFWRAHHGHRLDETRCHPLVFFEMIRSMPCKPFPVLLCQRNGMMPMQLG